MPGLLKKGVGFFSVKKSSFDLIKLKNLLNSAEALNFLLLELIPTNYVEFNTKRSQVGKASLT